MDAWQTDNKNQKFSKEEMAGASENQKNKKPMKQDPDESLKATLKVFLIMAIITMGLQWLGALILLANLNTF